MRTDFTADIIFCFAGTVSKAVLVFIASAKKNGSFFYFVTMLIVRPIFLFLVLEFLSVQSGFWRCPL